LGDNLRVWDAGQGLRNETDGRRNRPGNQWTIPGGKSQVKLFEGEINGGLSLRGGRFRSTVAILGLRPKPETHSESKLRERLVCEERESTRRLRSGWVGKRTEGQAAGGGGGWARPEPR